MGKLVYLIILIIDIIAIVDIVKGHKDLEKKALWIIAVVFLPILGPILYYVFAKKTL